MTTKVLLSQTGDMEPRCPACCRENALHPDGNRAALKCRDCGYRIESGNYTLVYFRRAAETLAFDIWLRERAAENGYEHTREKQALEHQVRRRYTLTAEEKDKIFDLLKAHLGWSDDEMQGLDLRWTRAIRGYITDGPGWTGDIYLAVMPGDPAQIVQVTRSGNRWDLSFLEPGPTPPWLSGSAPSRADLAEALRVLYMACSTPHFDLRKNQSSQEAYLAAAETLRLYEQETKTGTTEIEDPPEYLCGDDETGCLWNDGHNGCCLPASDDCISRRDPDGSGGTMHLGTARPERGNK